MSVRDCVRHQCLCLFFGCLGFGLIDDVSMADMRASMLPKRESVLCQNAPSVLLE